MTNKTKEIISAVVTLSILVIIIDPFLWDYTMMETASLTIALLTSFVAFQVFIWRNKPQDEREIAHENMASRVGYFTGTAVLIIGVVVQSFNHEFDAWLIGTLFIMIVGKIGACVYSQRFN